MWDEKLVIWFICQVKLIYLVYFLGCLYFCQFKAASHQIEVNKLVIGLNRINSPEAWCDSVGFFKISHIGISAFNTVPLRIKSSIIDKMTILP